MTTMRTGSQIFMRSGQWNELWNEKNVPLRFTNPNISFDGSERTKAEIEVVDSQEKSLVTRNMQIIPWQHDIANLHLPERDSLILMPCATRTVGRRLTARNIGLADTRGNCDISWPGVMIKIYGQQAVTSARSHQKTAVLFSVRRAQVAAMILTYPWLLSEPVRVIARYSGVSVGTVSNALKIFQKAGYLAETMDGHRLVNAELFLSAWARAYPTGLGADLELLRGKAQQLPPYNLEHLGVKASENALSDHISDGQSASLYLGEETFSPKVIKELRLVKNPAGTITLRRAFWNTIDVKEIPEAIVYADLLNSDDARLRDVAQIIKAIILKRTRGDWLGGQDG
ncbi:DNA-binding protein [Corynebacterium diphtheriae]|nr:DNA-binding protein [Corynebacterium diphtheriae]